MALYQLGDIRPQIGNATWVAESASVIGRVQLHDEASVWYGCVLRGDNDLISIGARSNVQDLSVLHTDSGFPLTLGSDVSVGHQVMLHGCTIGEGSLIGIQSVVLNGAVIGPRCLVGAGSLITEGKVFPEGSMILGRPAKVVRPLTPEEIDRIALIAAHYVAQAQRHRGGLKRID